MGFAPLACCGPCHRLEAAGHRLQERCQVPDDRCLIRAEVSRWIADPAVQVMISSGAPASPVVMAIRKRWLPCSKDHG